MIRELEACKNLVDSTFEEMNEAKQCLKACDQPRFKLPFGSEEREIAENAYEEALRDYKTKAEAFAAARKLYDDSRMHLSARRE
jgi:hypothetical protein